MILFVDFDLTLLFSLCKPGNFDSIFSLPVLTAPSSNGLLLHAFLMQASFVCLLRSCQQLLLRSCHCQQILERQQLPVAALCLCTTESNTKLEVHMMLRTLVAKAHGVPGQLLSLLQALNPERMAGLCEPSQLLTPTELMATPYRCCVRPGRDPQTTPNGTSFGQSWTVHACACEGYA